MYKRFYSLKSSSMGIRVLLEEIGASCLLIQISVNKGTPRQLCPTSHARCDRSQNCLHHLSRTIQLPKSCHLD